MTPSKLLLFGIFTIGISRCYSALGAEKMAIIFREIFKDYDNKAFPIKNGKPLDLKIAINIQDMVPTKLLDMHYSVNMFLQLRWTDFRLQYNATYLGNHRYIPCDWRILEELWVPNLHLHESKFAIHHNIPDPNLSVFLYPNGEVVLHRRIAIRLFCKMNLGSFPFDVQHCKISMEPYSFHTVYLNLRWDWIVWAEHLYIRDFDEVSIRNSSDPYYRYYPTTIKSWSRLYVLFTFKRNINLYLIRDFLPCFIIVSLSWINFWVNHRSTPARTTLSITTVLTIVTMTNMVRANSPSAELFRSIDYYLWFCNLFVFAALAETTLVGMTAPNSKPINKSQQLMDMLQNDDDDDDGGDDIGDQQKDTSNRSDGKTKAPAVVFPIIETVKIGPFYFFKGETHVVDRICRVAFPVAFFLYNIIFFLAHYFQHDTVLSQASEHQH